MHLKSAWSSKQNIFEGQAGSGSIEEGHKGEKYSHINISAVNCTKDGFDCNTSMPKIKGGIVHRAVSCHVLVVLLRLQV